MDIKNLDKIVEIKEGLDYLSSFVESTIKKINEMNNRTSKDVRKKINKDLINGLENTKNQIYKYWSDHLNENF